MLSCSANFAAAARKLELTVATKYRRRFEVFRISTLSAFDFNREEAH
jgi:hypothetical protein